MLNASRSSVGRPLRRSWHRPGATGGTCRRAPNGTTRRPSDPGCRSVAAARRALAMAAAAAARRLLVVLLSGGASALMAVPADGLTLDDKQDTIGALLRAGADIHALNTVRKHLSAIKGGRLAAAAAAPC